MQRKFSFEGIEIRLVSGEVQKNEQTSEKHSPKNSIQRRAGLQRSVRVLKKKVITINLKHDC